MIQSIGIDVVDIDRFEKIVERWNDKFLNRILTPKELEYCRQKHNALHSMAARFAAKEALIKCLPDQDQIGFSWHEMQVVNAENGRPVVQIQGRLEERLEGRQIHVSLSHSHNSAVAVIVLENMEYF